MGRAESCPQKTYLPTFEEAQRPQAKRPSHYLDPEPRREGTQAESYKSNIRLYRTSIAEPEPVGSCQPPFFACPVLGFGMDTTFWAFTGNHDRGVPPKKRATYSRQPKAAPASQHGLSAPALSRLVRASSREHLGL